MKNDKKKKDPNQKRNLIGIATILVWALILLGALHMVSGSMSETGSLEIPFSEFISLVKSDQVEKVELLSSSRYNIYLKEEAQEGWLQEYYASLTADTSEDAASSEAAASEAGTVTSIAVPDTMPTLYTIPVSYSDLTVLLSDHGVTYYTVDSASSSILSLVVGYVLPVVLMLGGMLLIFRLMGSKMGGGIGMIGKSNAKVYVEKETGVTFQDVAGQDEAKESLEEIIDFLHNPQKYTAIGAKLPKGALLVGSPGTGKTLLAKAVAGEAKVPFFSISGSDFVEMYVGVGASRVRDLFKEAAKMAPCIIFIDEIDTIGKNRDNRMGGNDEREQTLNQLLAELDGFDPTKGVIVLGATNRPEVLDKALLRPGRFDRRITVDRPNLAGRLATLQVHTRKIHLAEDVDLNKIAQATAGCVGADLANLVNEAALRAVRMGRKAVNQNDLLVSFELVIAGAEKKGTVLTEKEKKLIAYHEVGHALVAAMQKNSTPVSKITIVPHVQGALGYTMQTPEEEKFLEDKEELLTDLRTFLGGRAAEWVVFRTMTTGASNDIERATDMARKMVAMYGMSERFGVMGLATIRSQYLDGSYGMDCAQETAAGVDEEVRTLLNDAYRDAIHILEEHRDMLDAIAAYLLKKETITGAEMTAILEGRDPEQAEVPDAERRAQARIDQPGVEPAARVVHMLNDVPEKPPLPAPEEKDAPDGSNAGSGAAETAPAGGTGDAQETPEGSSLSDGDDGD